MRRYLFMFIALTASHVTAVAEERQADTDVQGIRFEEIDQNQDGRLNPDEARQNEELTRYFMVWDTDQNGHLDADEIRAGRETESVDTEAADSAQDDADPDEGQPNFTIIEMASSTEMDRLDADGDGAVTPAEWAESGVATRFSEVDADGNGVLDETELAAVNREATNARTAGTPTPQEDNEDTADADRSRRIQMMSDNPTGRLHFSALDTDDNGMVDRLEATDNNYVQAHFDEWDTDNNDLLDPAEVEQARLDVDMY